MTYEDFMQMDLRIGTIIKAVDFLESLESAIKLDVDLGELGIKRSYAPITKLYDVESLIGRQVTCVVNIEPKYIAGFKSEVLVLGGKLNTGDVVLLSPDEVVENGTKVL